MGLVIQQTKQAHQEIRSLLAALRRLQEVEVAVEIRMLYLSEASEEKILGGMELPSKNKVAFLDDVQQQALIEAVQKDKHIEMLQAPKLTLFNGQRGSIRVTDYQFFLTGVQASTTNGQTTWTPKNEPMEIGFHSSVCPTVSADRKSVFLDLQVKRTTLLEPVPLIPIQIPVPQVLEGPGAATTTLGQPVIFQMFIQQPQIATQVVDQKFSIPTGKTALIVAGKERRQTRTESAPAVLAQIPYLSRLFKNVSYARESCTTILLVTPRIIINKEEQDAIAADK
jgi:general secretion pathway protein D